ncbi:hypothetical protein AB1Y20_005786 [Prymnesium parvum]|uniref:Uncharacterized protein n=1 Tax=Prymnesium parvum TaxID=97485 RepID=A0AB34J274_PRYPA
MPRHVLVDMPISPYEWEPARLNTPGYEFGISGTHTALLAIAQSFVQHRWSVHLAGSIHGQPLPGMTYIRAGSWSASMQPPEFDLTVISNVFTPKQCLWNKVSTRALAIVQENQFIRPLEYALLSRYMKQCQRRMGGSGDTKLIFFHLSEWTKEAMIAHLNGRVVQDYFHSNVVNVRALKDNRWAMDPWVKHDTQTFRNPINLTLFRVARQLARPRNSRSLIFPACWERGGVVAAKVFAKLKTEWGDDARIHFSYYDTARKGNAEMRTVLALANGQQQDARVTHSPLSKLDLAIRMEVSTPL